MRLLFVFAFLLIFAVFPVFAQNSTPKINKLFYKDTIYQLGELKIEASNIYLNNNTLRFNVNVINPYRKNIFILKEDLFVNQESKVELNRGAEILPYKNKSTMLVFKGNIQQNYTIPLFLKTVYASDDSLISPFKEKFSSKSKGISNFKSEKNDIELTINEVNRSKKYFEYTVFVKNNGNDLVSFEGFNIKLINETKTEDIISQIESNQGRYYLTKGESKTLTIKFVDKKYDKIYTYFLDLSEAIKLQKLEKLKIINEFNLNLDVEKTALKNKLSENEIITVFPAKIIQEKTTIKKTDNPKTSFKYFAKTPLFNNLDYKNCFENFEPLTNKLETFPSSYLPSYDQTYTRVKKVVNTYTWKKDSLTILNEIANTKHTISKFVYNDLISFEWKEIENYINQLLSTVYSKDFLDSNNLKVLITKEPVMNASCLSDGTILINIALLANMNSEADLIMVLTHEISHYLHADGIKAEIVFNQIKKNSSAYSIFANYNKFNFYSREVESLADNYACAQLAKSNYNFSKDFYIFEKFHYYEEKAKSNKRYGYSKYFQGTHPNSEKRYFEMEEKLKNNNNFGKFYLDSCLFQKIKQQAIIETMEQYLVSNNEEEGLEFVLGEYLKNPKEEYLFYALELLRKATYMRPKLKDRPLFQINSRVRVVKYHKESEDSFNQRKIDFNKELVQRELVFNANENKIIDNSFFTNDNYLNLITYNELFDKLKEKINFQNCIECNLTVGLKYYFDDKEYKPYLNEYTNNEKALYKSVANEFLNPTKDLQLGQNQLFIWNEFNVDFNERKRRNEELNKLYNNNSSYFNYLKTEFENKKKNIVCYNNLDTNNFNLKENRNLNLILSTIKKSRILRTMPEINTWVLYPHLYEFYKTKNIGIIHYLDLDFITIHAFGEYGRAKLENKSNFYLYSIKTNNYKKQLNYHDYNNSFDTDKSFFNKHVSNLIRRNYRQLKNKANSEFK